MNPKFYHIPVSRRDLCPVCKKAVYSLSRIHPQCAMSQADPPKGAAKAQVEDPARLTGG